MRKILGHDARLFRQEVDPAGKPRRESHHHPAANFGPRKRIVSLNQNTGRLALHVLPKSFLQVRYSRLLRPCGRDERLAQCRAVIPE